MALRRAFPVDVRSHKYLTASRRRIRFARWRFSRDLVENPGSWEEGGEEGIFPLRRNSYLPGDAPFLFARREAWLRFGKLERITMDITLRFFLSATFPPFSSFSLLVLINSPRGIGSISILNLFRFLIRTSRLRPRVTRFGLAVERRRIWNN